MRTTLSDHDRQQMTWCFEQLGAILCVAEQERLWLAIQLEAGHLAAIPRDEAEQHVILLAKIRDLADVISDVVEAVRDGLPIVPEGVRPS